VGRFSLMGEMAAAIAHEINQPLSAISTYAQAARRLAQAEVPDKESLAEACEAVSKQAQRASQVIENLRSFIRKEEVKREPVDVNRTIQDVMPLIEADARTARIPLEIDFDGTLPPVQGDTVHLQQVLLNLTRNAVDAMRETPARSRGITIRTRRDGQRVEIAVTDAGPGVSARLGEDIFNPFVTTKKDGLGVGLAISRTIIEAHGGTLTYRPRESGGTVFVMSLPIEGESDMLDYDE
jgi:C4-dicarboxylate-specific signal transduction histidine kinase